MKHTVAAAVFSLQQFQHLQGLNISETNTPGRREFNDFRGARARVRVCSCVRAYRLRKDGTISCSDQIGAHASYQGGLRGLKISVRRMPTRDPE